MGFEDRSLAFLHEAQSRNMRLDTIVAIRYEPHDDRNKEGDFMHLAKEVGNHVYTLTYDRFSPEAFSKEVPMLCRNISAENAVVDISGLSKLGIVVLLNALTEWNASLSVFYAEAAEYHPTRDDFEKMKQAHSKPFVPSFLTTNVHDILSTTGLSSVSMLGYPIALAAFPTFNRMELSALYNEISPEKLFILKGMPPDKENAWRFDAVDHINEMLQRYAQEKKAVSTLRYEEALEALEEFYDKVRYTHRFVVAPTGSKMQSLAVFLFKRIHPDVQVLYPVVEKFKDEYTKRWSKLWQIDFEPFSKFVSDLHSRREQSLTDILKTIEES
jgi:hypothetical protein